MSAIASTQPKTTHPPGPKGDFLGLRSIRRFRQDALGYLTELARTYGDIAKFPFGPFPCYLVSHPDYVHQVYVEEAAKYHKTRLFKAVFKPSLGESLLTSDGDFWRRQRRLVQPAFHSKRIEAYGQVMVDYALRAMDSWAGGQERDLHHDMMHLTMAVVSKTLFDADVSADADEISQAISIGVETTNAKFNQVFQLPDWLPTRTNQRAKWAIAKINDVVMRFIRERRAASPDRLADRGDLLSMLLLAADDNGEGRMTDQQVRNEAYTLFVAGHETTAVALTWTWYLLSQHPRVEAKLVEELRAVLGDRPPTVHDLSRLPYTDMIVKESMRLYPPAWVTTREPQADVVIGGYTIPKLSTVFVSPWVSHHDPRYFKQPDEFLPERWADGFEKQLPKGAYFPFAAGPRVCIGNLFAQMEARLILATIAQRYRLELAPGQTIEPEPLITLRPRHGMRMRLAAQPG